MRYGMTRTAGSGCGKREKGDAIDEMFLCEGKSSRAGAVRVSTKMVDRAWKDARKMGKIPFIDLDLVEQGEIGRPRHFVVIPASVWQVLKKKLTSIEFELLRPR